MQAAQRRTLITLRSVQYFISNYAGVLPTVAGTGTSRKLDSIIAEIDGHSDTQDSTTASALVATRQHYAHRRDLLRDHIAAICTIARHYVPEVPALEAIRMPRQGINMQSLVNAAKQIADNAEQHASVFVAAGLSGDFVAQLRAAIADMVATVQERANTLSSLRGATRGIRAMLAEGRRQVEILDKLVRTALKGNEGLLSAWTRAKRITKSTVTTAVPAAPAAPAPVI